MLRPRVSLDGQWTVQPLSWLTLQADGSLREDDRSLPPVTALPVPANWDETPLRDFYGRVRYERTFDTADLPSGVNEWWLVCEGVDYFADVALNGVPLGTHEGYFQPFEFDLTPHLNQGINALTVTVTSPREQPGSVWPDNKRVIKGVYTHWDCRPGSWSHERGQDRLGGGIWGNVWLEGRNATTISGVKIRTMLVPLETPVGEARTDLNTREIHKKAIVHVDVELCGRNADVDLVCSIGELTSARRHVRVRRGSTHVALLLEIQNPPLWWTWDLGEPHLEELSVRLERDGAPIDGITRTIGLRELHFDEQRGEWWLNGERVFVRGTNMVPVLWAGTYDAETAGRDFELLRSADINGVRACVHVADPLFYDLCDREGLIVWQDFPLQWGYAPTNEFMENVLRQMEDLVRLLGHRPCIGMWCCQNEATFHNKYVMDPVLAASMRQSDSSRTVRPTSLYSEHTYLGWYTGEYHEYHDLPCTPVLTEFGAQAFPSAEVVGEMGRSGAPLTQETLAYHDYQRDQARDIAGLPVDAPLEDLALASQEHQARCLKYAIERYRKAKYDRLGGMFQFEFVDGWPAVTWSVVDYRRIPKPGYAALQQAYQRTLFAMDVLADDDGGWRLSPWIVNDRHQAFDECRWRICLLNADGSLVEDFQGVVSLASDGPVLNLPPIIHNRGAATQAILSLHAGEELLCENAYTIDGEWIPSNERRAAMPTMA